MVNFGKKGSKSVPTLCLVDVVFVLTYIKFFKLNILKLSLFMYLDNDSIDAVAIVMSYSARIIQSK